MGKQERSFLDVIRDLFTDDRLLPVISVIWIILVGTAVWAIDSERIHDWFPGIVFISGLAIVVGDFLLQRLRRMRK